MEGAPQFLGILGQRLWIQRLQASERIGVSVRHVQAESLSVHPIGILN